MPKKSKPAPHPPKNVHRVTIYLTPEQHTEVTNLAKELAKQRGTPVSMADVIRVLITKFSSQVSKFY
jgi:hypothetical protein